MDGPKFRKQFLKNEMSQELSGSFEKLTNADDKNQQLKKLSDSKDRDENKKKFHAITTVNETAVETEDIDISDDDINSSSKCEETFKILNIDSNSRIVSEISLGNDQKTDICVTKLNHNNGNFLGEKYDACSDPETSADELDLSDDEEFIDNPLDLRGIDLHSYVTVATVSTSDTTLKKFPFNACQDEYLTDNEISEDENEENTEFISEKFRNRSKVSKFSKMTTSRKTDVKSSQTKSFSYISNLFQKSYLNPSDVMLLKSDEETDDVFFSDYQENRKKSDNGYLKFQNDAISVEEEGETDTEDIYFETCMVEPEISEFSNFSGKTSIKESESNKFEVKTSYEQCNNSEIIMEKKLRQKRQQFVASKSEAIQKCTIVGNNGHFSSLNNDTNVNPANGEMKFNKVQPHIYIEGNSDGNKVNADKYSIINIELEEQEQSSLDLGNKSETENILTDDEVLSEEEENFISQTRKRRNNIKYQINSDENFPAKDDILVFNVHEALTDVEEFFEDEAAIYTPSLFAANGNGGVHKSAANNFDIGRFCAEQLDRKVFCQDNNKNNEGTNKDERANKCMKKEWTETDQSGSIRQVTEIKTETSIKVGGEGIQLKDHAPKSESSPEAKKEKSPESEEEMLSFVEKRNFFQRLSLTSETLPLTSKCWTQDVSLDDLPMAEGEIVKEQISFEDKLKMFEPDEENVRRKTQKKEKQEQPTVYRYDFTKQSKEQFPGSEFVVSELEKAEQIVKQVREELNAEEQRLKEPDFSLNSKEKSSAHFDSFTLEKVEQEVSSLLAEVDKEEQEMSDEDMTYGTDAERTKTYFTSDSKEHFEKEDNGSMDYDFEINKDGYNEGSKTEETEKTSSKYIADYQEDTIIKSEEQSVTEKLVSEYGESVILPDSEQMQSKKKESDEITGTSFLEEHVMPEQPSAVDKSPVTEISTSSFPKQLSSPSESVGIDVTTEPDVEKDAKFILDEGIGYSEIEMYKMGVITSYSEDEVEIGTKYDRKSKDHKETQESEKHVSWQIESSDTESSVHKQIDQHFEISTKVNGQIKSQILHEELDQSMEESPLEIKEITEDVEQALVSEADREKKVYKHIRTEIVSQELGEDIESGSPERKDLSFTVPTEKTSNTIADESLDLKEEDSFIVLNKTSDNIILTAVSPEVDLVSEICTAMEQESQIAWETSLHHKEESTREEEALEQIVVEHDDCLKEYEEAKDEHSLSEQLLALASDAHVVRALASGEMLPCKSDKIKVAQPALEHMFSKVSSSLTETELHRRSDAEIGYSRADKKEMRSLKSTKKVSTIEEHSSIESSCDSTQELAPQEIMKPDTVIRKDSCEDDYANEELKKDEDMLSRDSTYENLEKIDCKKDSEPFGTTEEHIISGDGGSDTPEEKFPADEVELEKFLDLEEPSQSYENQMDHFFENTVNTKIETYSIDEESKKEQNIFVKEMSEAFGSKHRLPQDDSKSPRDERKSDSDYENKSDNVGLIVTEQVTPHRKEESFSSSGETESHYYSVETSENGRTPQSTPAASRPCSSEFEINILSGHGSEYETCATSQDASGEVSGSYATAVTSQETSYSTACSSLSHSSRESAYSVDSESSGHLASVEVSSEASETLVPSAQEMELEFAQDIEMPILDEESPSSECMVKEPYDMEIPESVIRSGVELPFLKSWDLEERSFEEKNKALHDQWTWQYAHESELLDTLQEATSRHVEDIKQDVEALAMKGSVAEHDVQQQLCSHDSVVDFGPVYFTAHSTDSESKHNGENKYSDDEGKSKDIDDTYDMNQSVGVNNVSKDDRPFVYVSEAYSFKTESGAVASQEMDDSVEQVSTCIDEEQLSVSESSATHSEQTWQTSSIDTAVHVSCQIPTSCYISDAQSSMPAVDLLPDIPPDRLPDSEQIQVSDDGPLDPTPQPSIDMPSYLQLNGPIEVDYNPEYDTPDGDESAVRISENLASYQLQSEIAGFEIEGENSRLSQALDTSTNLASSPQLESMLPSVSRLDNGESQISDQDSLRTIHCVENISQTTLSRMEDFHSGRALETEKPEAQQEQPDNYREYDEHLGSGVLFHDEAIFLPESDQCNLRTHFEEQSDMLQTDAQDQTDMSRNLVVEEPSLVVHTEQNGSEENIGDKVGLVAKLQSGDSLEKTDVVDTSPEDERYDYKIQKSRNEQNYSIRQTSDYEVSLEWQNDSFKPGVEFVDSGSSDKTEACDKVSSSDKTLLPHFDDLTYVELYTHQEEDEETLDFELKEADRQQSPAPSAEEDKQSTPSFDILPGRRFFGRSGEHDDSSASSLQEFERLEAEMGTGRSSQGSGDSGDRPVASKSGEHDDISMCSLTEFEKLERECAEAEQIEKNVHDEAARLSEIEEGHESQASDSQETLSDAGQDHESDDSDDYEKRMTEIDEIIRMAQNNVEKFQEETADDLSEAITLEEYTVTQKTYTSSGNSTESSLVDRSPSPKKRQTSNEKGVKGHVAMGECEPMLENEYKLLHLEGKKEFDVSCSDNVEVGRDELTASVTHDATEDVELWIESGKVNADIEETEILTDSLEADNGGGGHDSSSSGGKNGGSGKGDCMVSSTDSLDPSSSTATHATYQFETDSVMSSSINSAQASGEECTMVSSTDTLEPEPKITYSQGEVANEEKITVSGMASDTNVRISSHEVVDDQSADQIEAVKPTQKFEWSVQTESHTSEYDIDETMKGFLKRTGKPTAESEHITSESQFHVVTSMSGDAEKISKDFLLALEKLETAQNIGQFEQADKDGKVVKVTQQVLIEPAEIQAATFSGPGTREQMEMFLKKLTDETEGNTTHILSGSFPHVASEYVEENDAVIQGQQSSSASFSTPFSSVTESSHYSTPCDPSSLPLDLAQSSEASFGFYQPDEGTAVTDDVVSRTTTTTTTRIVTTLSADDQVQPQDTQEGGDELRQSMEEILNQFMTEEESSQAAPSSQSQQKQ